MILPTKANVTSKLSVTWNASSIVYIPCHNKDMTTTIKRGECNKSAPERLKDDEDRPIPVCEMSKHQLVKKCESLQRQLVASNEALRSQNVKFREYVYSVSHDFNAALRSIGGFSSFLKEEYHSQLSSSANQYIDFIVGGVEKMKSRIHGLAKLSRVTTMAAKFELTDLNEVFADVLASAEDSIRKTGAKVTADELPLINGDRAQLTQLLENLINNSLTFTGDITPKIHVSVKKNTTELTISVSDNGIGVNPNCTEKVFNLFHRLDSPKNHTGAGIGLAICRQIAQRHSGQIWLEPRKGGGSIARLSLPISLAKGSTMIPKPLGLKQRVSRNVSG